MCDLIHMYNKCDAKYVRNLPKNGNMNKRAYKWKHKIEIK